MSDIICADMERLLADAGFRRFLWRMIERSGLLSPASTGSDGRDLSMAEGRRQMLLEALADVEQAMPVQHPSGWPVMALIQTLRDEVQTPQRDLEKPRGRRSRNDSYRDLRADGDDDVE